MLALAVVVAALGPALTLVPLNALRLVVGALLLVFGLQWLRKAILRAERLQGAARRGRDLRAGTAGGGDCAARRASRDRLVRRSRCRFKGVFLEGLEVAFIVLTFGSTQGSIPLAAAGAFVAIVLVALVGVLARAPLARVPENTMKFAVGIMLTTFGIFWSAEGAGADWPGGDAAILGVLAFVILWSMTLVSLLRRRRARLVTA